MVAEIKRHKLNFKFEAGTSRGVMTSKYSWFVKLFDEKDPQRVGIGECGPLPGLSPDLDGDLENELLKCTRIISDSEYVEKLEIDNIVSKGFPALRFAVETAIMDWTQGGKRLLYDNAFTNAEKEIPINGLVWMGDKRLMFERIKEKIASGFNCIKIKIGAINFQEELELLKYIRSRYSAEDIVIRLDANGAFDEKEILQVLDKLSKFDIHSIEQPIKAGKWEAMSRICQNSPVSIALDEELIGVKDRVQKAALLDAIRSQFIILKPTLVGGLDQSREWIELATERDIGWWMTSALESNIGLNAIAQFVSTYNISLPQGLGTGQLFHNNIPSPLYVENGRLGYDTESRWDISAIL